MWTLQKSAIFSQKIINLLFYTYMMNHWWYQLCSAFIIDNVSLEGLCAIYYSKTGGRHILQNYFFKRERFRWIIYSLLVDFPEPWCVIYEVKVFLILWRHTHYHCFVDFFKTFTFLARSMYCIFKELTFSPWYYVKRLPLPPLPTLANKQLCEDCFALGQSAVCIRCKEGGTFLM